MVGARVAVMVEAVREVVWAEAESAVAAVWAAELEQEVVGVGETRLSAQRQQWSSSRSRGC